MEQTRRAVLSAISAAGAAAGTVSGSSATVETASSSTTEIEPNDVVVSTSETASRAAYDDPDSQGPLVRPGQPGRARWRTTVSTGEDEDTPYWLVTWGKASDGWVPEESIKRRTARYQIGDTVELTSEAQAWEIVPSYFKEEDEIRSRSVGTTGEITRLQFFDNQIVWWQVQYEDFKGWTPESSFLPPEEATRRFSAGDHVRSTASVGSYRAPTYRRGAYGESLIGTVPRGETGTIKRGYSNKHGHKWWSVEWDEIDADGWAVEHNLTQV